MGAQSVPIFLPTNAQAFRGNKFVYRAQFPIFDNDSVSRYPGLKIKTPEYGFMQSSGDTCWKIS